MKFDAEQFEEQGKNMEEIPTEGRKNIFEVYEEKMRNRKKSSLGWRETLFDKSKSSRSIREDIQKICHLCTSVKLVRYYPFCNNYTLVSLFDTLLFKDWKLIEGQYHIDST